MSSLTKYGRDCRKEHRNPDTTEQSYYPAVKTLLEAHTDQSIDVSIELSVSGGSTPGVKKPDLGLYGLGLLIFVEVKPGATVAELLEDKDDQVRKYADQAGGWALATNLNDYVLVRIEGDGLAIQKTIRLFSSGIFGEKPPKQSKGASQQLQDILLLGCARRQAVRRPEDVAIRLAVYARELANDIPVENLGVIKEAFKNWLGTNLQEKFLVSTTVQAVVYGIFAVWLESEQPDDFQWDHIRTGLDVGVIAQIVYHALGPGVEDRPKVKGLLEGIAELLRQVDRDAFAEEFDGGAIEYFYEPFLAAYDPNLRKELGVWYTPKEVAAYQVARVDRHLREDLHKEGGLANRHVVVLDPAVGTGTYLAAVYDYIYATCLEDGDTPSEAARAVQEAAKSRIVGFDILPAALLIADLYLRRKLRQHGASLGTGERPAVFLTNSLRGWFDRDDPKRMALPWPVAREEVEAANRYKRDETVLAVLGNPPYQGFSPGKPKDKKDSAKTEEDEDLLAAWKKGARSEWGLRKHRLDDSYVQFWAAATRRIATFTKMGVVSFITNRTWLGGRSFPTMREVLLSDFDKLMVDDLGGDSRGSSTVEDGSVFSTATAAGTRVGAAIVTAVRYPDTTRVGVNAHIDRPEDAEVWQRSLTGSGAAKRTALSQFRNARMDDGLSVLSTSKDQRWKLKEGSSVSEDWVPIGDYFEFYQSGVQPGRDDAFTDYDRVVLAERMETYFDPGISWGALTAQYPAFAVKRSQNDGPAVRQKLLDRNKDFKRTGIDETRIVKCLWKPLSRRWLYWEPHESLLHRRRPELIPYWKVQSQVCLVSTGNHRRNAAAQPLVSTAVPIYSSMDPDVRALPLWKQHQVSSEDGLGFEGGEIVERLPNIQDGWIQAARAIGAQGTNSQIAETLFYALCGVVASPEWLATQPDSHDDFPSIPLPSDPERLKAAAKTGRKYAALVDPWVDVPGVTKPPLHPEMRGIAEPYSPTGSDPILKYGKKAKRGGTFDGETLRCSEDGGWRHIPSQVKDFTLGGFDLNPIQKHLSYFVGETLTWQQMKTVTGMVRRTVAISALAPDADAHFQAAKAAPLEMPHLP